MASTPKAEKDRSILVLVQLAGGNDGLNTFIPYEDSNYYKLRPTIGIKKKDAQQDETMKLLLENGADIEDEIADVIVEEDPVNRETPKKK